MRKELQQARCNSYAMRCRALQGRGTCDEDGVIWQRQHLLLYVLVCGCVKRDSAVGTNIRTLECGSTANVVATFQGEQNEECAVLL